MSRIGVKSGAQGLGWFSSIIYRVESITTQNALLWGLAWLIISTIAGWYLCLIPSGVVGYQVVGLSPLVWYLMQNVVVWIISASVLYAVVLLHNRRAQVVDTYGRLLFAHWPATLLLLPVVVVGKVEYCLLVSDLAAAFAANAITTVLYMLFVIVVVLWVAWWSYLAFRRGAGRGGWVTVVSYAVGCIVATLLSSWVLDVIWRGAQIG